MNLRKTDTDTITKILSDPHFGKGQNQGWQDAIEWLEENSLSPAAYGDLPTGIQSLVDGYLTITLAAYDGLLLRDEIPTADEIVTRFRGILSNLADLVLRNRD